MFKNTSFVKHGKGNFMKTRKVLIIAAAFVLVLAFMILGASSAFADSISDGDFEYTENSDGTLTLAYYNGKATEITVPSAVNGKTVTHIGRLCINLPDTARNLKKVKLPDTIVQLDEFAFSRCESLTDINLPEGLTTISNYVFYNNYSLEEIKLPSTLKTIGSRAFINCKSLKELDLPAGLESIQSGSTPGCESLECFKIAGDINGSNARMHCTDGVLFWTATNTLMRYPAGRVGVAYSVPEGTEELPSMSFDDCLLEEVTIPSTVTKIDGAFKNAKHLEKYIVSPDNETYVAATEDFDGYSLFKYNGNGKFTLVSHPAGSKVKEYVLADQVTAVEGGAFYNCIYLESVVLAKVEKLGAGTFRYCNALTEVSIPETTTDIYHTAFMDCYNLAKIDVDPDNPNYVSDNGVLYTKGYEVLYIYPIGRPDKSYQVHEGCSEIKTMAFEDNRYLEEIDLKGVKKIGNYAFGNADSLAKVTFDPEVESLDLDARAFNSCTALTRLEFPANLKSLGSEVFANSTVMKKVFFRGPCPEVTKNLYETDTYMPKVTYYVFPQYLSEYQTMVDNYTPHVDVTVVEWNGEEVPDLETYDMSGVKFNDATFTYDGTKKTIKVTGTLPSGVTVTYTGNGEKNVGVHQVVAWFTGDDKHEPIPNMTAYYTIKKAGNQFTGDASPVFDKNGNITWNIKATFGKVKLTFSKTKNGTYTSTVPTAPGMYFVKASVAGTDNYEGISKIAKVKVLPLGTTISSVSAASKGFTVKWKKPSAARLKNIDGYEIQYSTSAKFKTGNKTVTVTKKSTVSKKITKLKAKKKYYVRIRTFKKVSGTKYYSVWSEKKSVTTNG